MTKQNFIVEVAPLHITWSLAPLQKWDEVAPLQSKEVAVEMQVAISLQHRGGGKTK